MCLMMVLKKVTDGPDFKLLKKSFDDNDTSVNVISEPNICLWAIRRR